MANWRNDETTLSLTTLLTTMNILGRKSGSSSTGSSPGSFLLSPFSLRRRRRRYDVERFRLLYATLLRDIAPPPVAVAQAEPTNDEGDEEATEQQQQGQQQQQDEGGEPSQESSASQDQRQPTIAASEIDPSADLSEELGPDAPPPASESSSQHEEEGRRGHSPSRYGGGSGGEQRAQQAERGRRRIQRQPSDSTPAGTTFRPGLTEASAWRILSATPSPDKEGNCFDTALATRDDVSVSILKTARAREARVVDTIRCIGEAVAARDGGGDGEEDEIWAYFCDKNILALLVDIARAKPPSLRGGNAAETAAVEAQQFGGVVWTPLVKVQVLQTVSTLLSNVKDDDTSLYYLLSNNHVNDLTSFLVPLRQWTDHALEEMMPYYISFLKNLALRLAQAPHLFQFFVDARVGSDESAASSSSFSSSTTDASNTGAAALSRFPLLHSSVHVASSSFAQSDAFVHQTALNIILNLCQIPSGHVRTVIGEAVIDQQTLLSHLCQRLVGRYRRIAHLAVGVAAGDPSRCSALGAEISDLQDQLHFVNDLLWCGVRPLNVRACEYLLRYVLFHHVLPGLLMHNKSKSMRSLSSNLSEGEVSVESVGRNTGSIAADDSEIIDDPIIKEGEAMSQASVVFLTQLFLALEYTPLLKMCSVAILHPYSPANWATLPKKDSKGGDYVLTSALNAVVQNKCTVLEGSKSELISTDGKDATDADQSSMHAVHNSYRAVLLSLTRGDLGYRRFIPTAMLLQSILDSEDLDGEFLTTIRLLPAYSSTSISDSERKLVSGKADTSSTISSEFEAALDAFLTRTQRPSLQASVAIECGGSLAISLLSHLIVAMTDNGTNFDHFHERFTSSPLVLGLADARKSFALKAKAISRAAELSDSFIDLVELELSRRYVLVPGENGTKVRLCDLNANNAHQMKNNAEILVQKLRDTSANEIEDAKFVIRALLYLRSMCRVLVEVHQRLSSFIGPHSLSSRWGEDAFEIRTVEVMEDDYTELGGQKERPSLGTDLDVRGRTFFYFAPSLTGINPHQSASDGKRRLAQELIIMATPGQSELLLVLDPTDLFILKPNLSDGSCNRGTILCSASLESVIAAVPEKEWLHIAIRQTEDVGIFIKNGNMSLRFDSVGTCLIVKQYLERCRSALCSKMMANVDRILDDCSGELFSLEPIKQQQVGGEALDGCGDWSAQKSNSIESNEILGEGEEEVVLEEVESTTTELVIGRNVAEVSC